MLAIAMGDLACFAEYRLALHVEVGKRPALGAGQHGPVDEARLRRSPDCDQQERRNCRPERRMGAVMKELIGIRDRVRRG